MTWLSPPTVAPRPAPGGSLRCPLFATADPDALLWTTAFAKEALVASVPLLLDNEFAARPDVNRFVDSPTLGTKSPVSTRRPRGAIRQPTVTRDHGSPRLGRRSASRVPSGRDHLGICMPSPPRPRRFHTEGDGGAATGRAHVGAPIRLVAASGSPLGTPAVLVSGRQPKRSFSSPAMLLRGWPVPRPGREPAPERLFWIDPSPRRAYHRRRTD